MKEKIANVLVSIGLSGLTVLIVLLVGEGLTRFVYHNKLDYQVEMSRYAALITRRVDHPLISHVQGPNSEAILMGVPVKINSHGFRDAEYPLEKPVDEFRILLLGDSLTFGWGVHVFDRFSDLLERNLGAFVREATGKTLHVVNTAVANYNTTQEVSAFRDVGRKFEPDLVILNYFINDAEPVPTTTSPIILKYSYLAMWLWGRLDTISRRLGRQVTYHQYYADLYDEGSDGWIKAKQALTDLSQLSREDGFRWMIAILPELHEVGPQYGFAAVHAKVVEAAQRTGADGVLDIADAFIGNIEPSSLWVAPDDAHPNAKGHRLIATALGQFLTAHLELFAPIRKLKSNGQ